MQFLLKVLILVSVSISDVGSIPVRRVARQSYGHPPYFGYQRNDAEYFDYNNDRNGWGQLNDFDGYGNMYGSHWPQWNNGWMNRQYQPTHDRNAYVHRNVEVISPDNRNFERSAMVQLPRIGSYHRPPSFIPRRPIEELQPVPIAAEGVTTRNSRMNGDGATHPTLISSIPNLQPSGSQMGSTTSLPKGTAGNEEPHDWSSTSTTQSSTQSSISLSVTDSTTSINPDIHSTIDTPQMVSEDNKKETKESSDTHATTKTNSFKKPSESVIIGRASLVPADGFPDVIEETTQNSETFLSGSLPVKIGERTFSSKETSEVTEPVTTGSSVEFVTDTKFNRAHIKEDSGDEGSGEISESPFESSAISTINKSKTDGRIKWSDADPVSVDTAGLQISNMIKKSP